MEELIKNYFKGQKQKEFCIGNHGNYKCGIITNDKVTALNILNKIQNDNKDNVISFYVDDINAVLRLKNGDNYLWIKPILSSKAYRFHEMYIDKNISYEFFEYVLPIVGFYCSGKDVHII